MPRLRLLEISRPVAMGIGEAAASVAEKLGREQRVRNASAVDRNERLAATRTLLVNQSRDDFLADAALAGDQDLRVGARGALMSYSIWR